MLIYTITKEQLPIVRDLAYKIWPHAYGSILSVAQLDYMLDNFYSLESLAQQMNNGHVFMLAEIDTKIVGFASYELHHGGSTNTKLHKIYVLPETQGSGLGKRLIEEVIQKAITAQNTHLFLNVNKYNSAKQFYEKQQFVVVKEEVIPIGNGYVMDDYVMEKKL